MSLPDEFLRLAQRDVAPPFDAPSLFIGGDGRSGTTLISVMLNCHPRLAVGPELHFKGPPNLGPYVLEGLKLLAEGAPQISEAGIRENPQWRSAKRFVGRARRFGVPDEVLGQLCRLAIEETRSELSAFEDRAVLIQLMGTWIAFDSGKPRWGMKIMREIRRPVRYRETWPQGHFIHVVRDGRDVASSQLRDHPGWGYTDVESAAAKWQELVLTVRDNPVGVPLTALRYEDAVQDSERTLRGLLAAIEEPWDPAVLDHTRTAHAVSGVGSAHPSKEALLRPVNASAVGRYRQDLSAGEIEAIERGAARGLAAYGYAVQLR